MSVKYEASGDALVWFAGCKRGHLQEDLCVVKLIQGLFG